MFGQLVWISLGLSMMQFSSVHCGNENESKEEKKEYRPSVTFTSPASSSTSTPTSLSPARSDTPNAILQPRFSGDYEKWLYAYAETRKFPDDYVDTQIVTAHRNGFSRKMSSMTAGVNSTLSVVFKFEPRGSDRSTESAAFTVTTSSNKDNEFTKNVVLRESIVEHFCAVSSSEIELPKSFIQVIGIRPTPGHYLRSDKDFSTLADWLIFAEHMMMPAYGKLTAFEDAMKPFQKMMVLSARLEQLNIFSGSSTMDSWEEMIDKTVTEDERAESARHVVMRDEFFTRQSQARAELDAFAATLKGLPTMTMTILGTKSRLDLPSGSSSFAPVARSDPRSRGRLEPAVLTPPAVDESLLYNWGSSYCRIM